jgi:S1-C subfamily serine protease
MRAHLRITQSLAAGLAAATLFVASHALAQRASLEDVLSGIVHVKTFINPDARTIENLGREREGTGILIDDNSLILTIGYLMVEAHAAEIATGAGRTLPANVVGYDHESGFGLLRTIEPLKLRPVPLGKSSEVKSGDPVLAASFGGAGMVMPVRVAARREFAGGWEYLLDEAIFTAPPHPAWSGAALIDRTGKLVGVGSLIVGDAAGKGEAAPGNMFVPIDRLPPILADLIATGRAGTPPKPWLGITTVELQGHLFAGQVTPGGPAEQAGVQRGDQILGVNGVAAKSMADLYRQVWAQGSAGAVIPLDILQDSQKRRVEVRSMNRLDHLKLKSTY